MGAPFQSTLRELGLFGRLETGGQKSGREAKSLSSRATLLAGSGVALLACGLGAYARGFFSIPDLTVFVGGPRAGRPAVAGAMLVYRLAPIWSALSASKKVISLRNHAFRLALNSFIICGLKPRANECASS